MDLRFKKSVMGTVLLVICLKFYLIQGFDYNWCLYRYYSQALPWAAASSVCKQKGLKLAVMTEQASYDYVTSLIMTSLWKFYRDVENTMWIGLHKDYSGNLRHDDCTIYSAKDFNPTQNLLNSCVYLDAMDTTFKAGECTRALPFLCQHAAPDLNKCYDERTSGESKLAPMGFAFGRNAVADCSKVCTHNCFGFKYDTDAKACTMLSYTADAVPGRPHDPYYTKALLDLESYTIEATVEPADICSVAAGEPTVTTDVLVLTPSNTLQSGYVTEADLTTGIAEAASHTETTTDDVQVLLPLSSYQSSYGTIVDTATDIDTLLSSISDTYTQGDFEGSHSLNSTCDCSCEEPNNETLSKEQLKEKVQQLREQLFVNKKGLSSWKRKLVSAEDKRTSAKGIGFVGAGILIAVAVALVILDIPTLVVETKKLAKTFTKCRREKHQSI